MAVGTGTFWDSKIGGSLAILGNLVKKTSKWASEGYRLRNFISVISGLKQFFLSSKRNSADDEHP